MTYEFTPYSFAPMYHPGSNDEEYKILGHNPDDGKVGVSYSGEHLIMAWTDDKDTAAYIVKCVNSHEQLVEALNTIKKIVSNDDCEGVTCIRNDDGSANCGFCKINRISKALEGVSND